MGDQGSGVRGQQALVDGYVGRRVCEVLIVVNRRRTDMLGY